MKLLIFRAFWHYTLKHVLAVTVFSMLVTTDRFTRYYVNQSGGGEIGPVYWASFRMKRGNVVGPFHQGALPFC